MKKIYSTSKRVEKIEDVHRPSREPISKLWNITCLKVSQRVIRHLHM